jgi:hypothetical protein
VARTESGVCQWAPNGSVITSSAGAIGVMQLEPATAAQLGVDPTDVNQNIKGGITYLKQLYQQYGSWDLALAAYNWGPGNLSNAIASASSIPGQVANYVKGILGMGTVYNAGLTQMAAQQTPEDSDSSSDSTDDASALATPPVNLAACLLLGGFVVAAIWLAD